MDSKFDGILEPISKELPCGEDLSFSPEFDAIQEARREDDSTIDYGDWQSELKQADWVAVVNSCTALLQKRSKDLRLSAWLTEGLTKTSGLAGLGEGLDITARLLERFGTEIHPQPEEGDQERRISTISWFVMRMSQLARQIPITYSKPNQFSLNDYESARLLQSQLQRNPDSVSDLENKVTLEKFSAAVAKTDKARYTQWLADAQRCRLSLAELVRASDALFGLDGPSFGPLTESLDAVYERLQRIGKDLGLLSAAEIVGEGAADSATHNTTSENVSFSHSGPIKTRAQALDLLRQVATFFRETEPHSPVAYLADKAVHWGNMPLHSWLRSIVKDQGTLSHIEELLGLEEKLERGSSED